MKETIRKNVDISVEAERELKIQAAKQNLTIKPYMESILEKKASETKDGELVGPVKTKK